jgi:small-conductance mechanosensitive channel
MTAVAQAPGPFLRGSPYLASALAVGGFLLVWGFLLRIGPRLGAYVERDAVEAIQAVATTVVGTLAAGVLVYSWRLTDEVWDSLGVVAFDARTGVKVMLTLLVFGAAFTGTRITKQFVKRGERRDAISEHQREIAHHVVQIVVFVPAILFTLSFWGFSPGNLLLGAGAAGIVVGLAARQTLGAVLAGFVLLGSRPFEVGDWVVVDDEEGVVTDISIFNTQIRTFDNEQVVIPNDQVTGESIVNRTRNGQLRITVDVGVDYDADVQHALAVAADAMADVDAVLDTPAPDAVLDSFGDSAVVLTLRFWIRDPTIERKWEAQNRVVETVKTAFEREGIKIPFPQRELAGREEADGFRVRGSGSERAPGETGAPAEREDLESAVEERDGEDAAPDTDAPTPGADED